MNQRLMIIFICLFIQDAIGQLQHHIESTSIGDKVAAWTPASGINPEELQNDITKSVFNEEDPSALTWPFGLIPYEIVGFTTSERAKITEAINDIHRATCVRFVPRTVESIYVSITSSNDGCYSAIGYQYTKYNINLQPPACLHYKGTILHELLHAIGLNHEQNRSDRHNFIKVNWNNIDEADENKFHQYHYSGREGSYNYLSLMHFSNKAFSKNGLPTLQGVKGFENVIMGQRVGLTVEDVDAVNSMYSCYLKPDFVSTIIRAPDAAPGQRYDPERRNHRGTNTFTDTTPSTEFGSQSFGSYYVNGPSSNLQPAPIYENQRSKPETPWIYPSEIRGPIYRILKPIPRESQYPDILNSATKTYQGISSNTRYSLSVLPGTPDPYNERLPNGGRTPKILAPPSYFNTQNSRTNTHQTQFPQYGYSY